MAASGPIHDDAAQPIADSNQHPFCSAGLTALRDLYIVIAESRVWGR